MWNVKLLLCASVLLLVPGLTLAQKKHSKDELFQLQFRIAKALEGGFASNGFEVSVSMLDYGVVLVDCTKNQSPHVTCRRLYETYPETRDDTDILRAVEIRELVFRYQDGFLTETKQYRKSVGPGTPPKKSTPNKEKK